MDNEVQVLGADSAVGHRIWPLVGPGSNNYITNRRIFLHVGSFEKKSMEKISLANLKSNVQALT